MVKVVGPLFSVEARKALGKVLTYQKRPSCGAVYGYSKPGSVVEKHKEPTAAQEQMRAYYREAFEHWRMLTEEDKEEWRESVRGY